MLEPEVNNFATNRISEGKKPTPSKQQVIRNLYVSNTLKFQIVILGKHNFSENSGLPVEKQVILYICPTT